MRVLFRKRTALKRTFGGDSRRRCRTIGTAAAAAPSRNKG
jgi:hypothetical protein